MSAGGSYQVKVTKELFGPYAYQLGKNMAYLCVKLSSHYILDYIQYGYSFLSDKNPIKL